MKVTGVAQKGAAAEADLRVGDIIVTAAGLRTQSFEDLAAVLAGAKGPIEIVIVNGENNKLERMQIVPVNGKIGIATVAAVLD
jgi:membrane-associated protease RseP (regulator of RpoE activity)